VKRARAPYEAMPLRRRYLWNAAQRQREVAYWPGCKSDRQWDTAIPRQSRRGYQPRHYATQEWWGGARYFNMNHWRMRELRA
jgi:hypothetical protein